MGKITDVLTHPKFSQLPESAQRFLLQEAGVPVERTDRLALVLARAQSMANAEDAQASIMVNPSQPLSALPGRLMSGAGETLTHLGKAAILPTALGAIGGVAAPFVPVAGRMPQAPMVGQALGGMAGEALNQYYGITSPSVEQIGMAGMPALAAKPLGRMAPLEATIPQETMSKLVSRIPGGAPAIAEQAAEEIRARPGILRATTASMMGEGTTVNSLFGTAMEQNPRILTTTLQRTVRELQPREASAAEGGLALGGKYQKVLDAMDTTLWPAGAPTIGGVSQGGSHLDQLELWRKRLGAMLEHTNYTNSEERGFLGKLYYGILDDYQRAADQGVAGAGELRLGIQMAKRQFGADDLEKMIEHVGFLTPRPDGIPDPRTGAMLRQLTMAERDEPSKTMQLFRDSVTPQEFDDIKGVLEFWNERKTALAPPRGAQYGSGQAFGLAGVGYAAGGMELASELVAGRWALTHLLMTDTGRAALRNLIARDQPISVTELTTLAMGQAAREYMQPSPSGMAERLMRGIRSPGETRFEAEPRHP